MSSKRCTSTILAAFTLAVLWCSGLPARADQIVIDPDSFTDGTVITSAFSGQGVLLSAVGAPDANVYAVSAFSATTPPNAFGWMNAGFPDEHWARPDAPSFQASFQTFQANSVSIDILSDSAFTMTALDSGGGTIGAVTSTPDFAPTTLTFSSASDNIKQIILTSDRRPGADFGTLDHLVINTGTASPIPEPGTLALLAGPGLAGIGLLRRRTLSR